jgi:hypothetical protein
MVKHKAAAAWVSGHSLDIPQTLCQFEIECARLHLDPKNTAECAINAELVKWVEQNKNSRYVPTALLYSALHMTTEWDGGREHHNRGRISYVDIHATLHPLEA